MVGGGGKGRSKGEGAWEGEERSPGEERREGSRGGGRCWCEGKAWVQGVGGGALASALRMYEAVGIAPSDKIQM